MKNLHFISFIFLLAITSISAQPALDWVAQMSGDEMKAGYSTTLDADGNLYVTGYFYGTVDFDPGTGVNELTAPAGEQEIFVLKLNSQGDFVWVQDLGKGIGRSIDYDNGYVYVTGNYKYTAGGVNASGIFVKKIAAIGGSVEFEYYITNSDGGKGYAIGADGDEVFVVGDFFGSADFDMSASGSALLTSNGESDIFILKLTDTGDFGWVKSYGGVAIDKATSIFVDTYYIYIVGTFRNTVDFNGTILATPDNYDDIFFMGLDRGYGVFRSVKQFGGTHNDIAFSVTKNSQNNFLIGGYFYMDCDFDPTSTSYVLNSTSTDYDAFILEIDNGFLSWVKQFEAEKVLLRNIELDDNDNIYATGYFKGTLVADPSGGTSHNLISNGEYDIFQLKLNGTDSELDWAYSYGSPENDVAVSLSVTPDGSKIYTTGYFNQTVDFDPDDSVAFELLSTGEEDIFVQKLSLTSGAVNQDVVGSGWKVYPNPFTGNFEIDLQDEKIKSVEITDYSGKRIYVNNNINAYHWKISGTYPRGLYLVKVRTATATHTFKMIKE